MSLRTPRLTDCCVPRAHGSEHHFVLFVRFEIVARGMEEVKVGTDLEPEIFDDGEQHV